METYLAYLTIFLAAVALALTAQAVILILVYVKIKPVLEEARDLRWQIADLYERTLPILRDAQETTVAIKEGTRRVMTDISEISGDVQRRIATVDRFTDSVASRFRYVLRPAVKKSVITPLREATALLHGVKAAAAAMARRRRDRGKFDHGYGGARRERSDRPEQAL